VSAPQRPAGAGEAATDPYQAVEHELGRLLRRVRSLTRAMAHEVHPDLDPTAYGLLIRLEEVGDARLTDLATYFGVGKPTLSRQLAFLARLGLVRGRADPADGRVTRLELTEEAVRRIQEVRGTRRGQLRAALERWPVDDVTELGELLHRLNAASPTTPPGD
jgi:DNA-binding MarR family transcriptional regulator